MFHIFMIPLTQTIHDQYDKLPAGERKIADILLEYQGELAAYSASRARRGLQGHRDAVSPPPRVRRLPPDAPTGPRVKRVGSPLAALRGLIGVVGEIGLVPTAGAVAGALEAFDGVRRMRLPMKDSPAACAMNLGRIPDAERDQWH